MQRYVFWSSCIVAASLAGCGSSNADDLYRDDKFGTVVNGGSNAGGNVAFGGTVSSGGVATTTGGAGSTGGTASAGAGAGSTGGSASTGGSTGVAGAAHGVAAGGLSSGGSSLGGAAAKGGASGAAGKGVITAELDINPDLWFFKCHFINDPVMPGCLGLDAMWQLVGFFLGWSGAPGKGRALGVGERLG